MASHGLTTTAGSGSTGRRPGRSSRVKQSCRLLKLGLPAPRDRSRSENSRQHAIETSRTSGFSILLNQPMKRVSAARGMRLVSRKLRSSCWVRLAIRPRTVMNLSAGLASACWHGFVPSDSRSVRRRGRRRRGSLPQTAGAAGAVAGQAPLADRTFPDVALVARLVPFYEFDIDDFFRADGAPAEVATQRQDGFFRLAAPLPGRASPRAGR